MNIKIRKILLPIFAIIILNTSCATAPVDTSETKNSPFTHGNVQLSIKKGITTQAEVLEKFGAPNIATIDSSGYEVWTYQKYATRCEKQCFWCLCDSFYSWWNIIFFRI